MRIACDVESGVRRRSASGPWSPLEPLDDRRQNVLRSRWRGTVYPYELTAILAGTLGSFTEHDLDADGRLVAGGPPRGHNTAALVKAA